MKTSVQGSIRRAPNAISWVFSLLNMSNAGMSPESVIRNWSLSSVWVLFTWKKVVKIEVLINDEYCHIHIPSFRFSWLKQTGMMKLPGMTESLVWRNMLWVMCLKCRSLAAMPCWLLSLSLDGRVPYLHLWFVNFSQGISRLAFKYDFEIGFYLCFLALPC